MKRAEVLDTAKEYVTKGSGGGSRQYGGQLHNDCGYWSNHLGHDVTPIDVGIMMTLLKIARLKGNPYHQDNYVDGCGYLACAGELVDHDG